MRRMQQLCSSRAVSMTWGQGRSRTGAISPWSSSYKGKYMCAVRRMQVHVKERLCEPKAVPRNRGRARELGAGCAQEASGTGVIAADCVQRRMAGVQPGSRHLEAWPGAHLTRGCAG